MPEVKRVKYQHHGIVPNILNPGQSARLLFDAQPKASQWRIYTAAGELVGKLDFGETLQNEWTPEGLASGLYFIRVTVEYAAGWTRDETFKVVVLH